MLLFRLGELKDALISEFGLRVVNGFLWEKKRGEFLENIRAVMQRKAEEIEDSEADEPEADHIPVVGKYDVGFIPTDSAFLLVYADAGDGHIKKIRTLGSYAQVTTSGKQFMADNSHKESAWWVEALDRLISWGWVKPVGSKGEIFELTGTGHRKAEWLKERMSINTDNEPQEEIKRFDV